MTQIPKPTFFFEETYWKNQTYTIGVDEVGKGCIAGPVVAGAVLFKPFFSFENLLPEQKKLFSDIHDSKLLAPQKRKLLASFLPTICLSFGIGESSVETINKTGIVGATHAAMKKAIKTCIEKYSTKQNYVLLIDGNSTIDTEQEIKKQQAIVKGDQKSISIAAASILAKVYRDTLMTNVDKIFPEYGFAKHKGYGTKFHQTAIQQHGLSIYHRTSFDLSRFFSLSF